MSEIKAIIHDWDDTVATGFDHYKNFYIDFAVHYGLAVPLIHNLKKSWGQTIPQIAHDQWPHLEKVKVESMVYEFMPIRKDNDGVKLFDGSADTIRELSANYLLAVLSSGNFDQIMRIYREQLSNKKMYHEIIVAPPNYVVHKAESNVLDPVMDVLRKKGVRNDEILFVGDHPFDKLAAETQGLLFVAVTTGVTERETFLEIGVASENILESFTHLPSFLKSLN